MIQAATATDNTPAISGKPTKLGCGLAGGYAARGGTETPNSVDDAMGVEKVVLMAAFDRCSGALSGDFRLAVCAG